MGLLRNNCYIRLELDGTYYIYSTKKDRLAEKKATPRSVIINKYREIIWELQLDQEAHYYQETPQLIQD